LPLVPPTTQQLCTSPVLFSFSFHTHFAHCKGVLSPSFYA
jgi:hypothetical protein